MLDKKTCLRYCPNESVSWFPEARLQTLKLFPGLQIGLRTDEITFKFHGEEQIMLGIIKGGPQSTRHEPWGRSPKYQALQVFMISPLFGFPMQHLNIFSLDKKVSVFFFKFLGYMYISILNFDDFFTIVKACKTSEVSVFVMFGSTVCLLLWVIFFLELTL